MKFIKLNHTEAYEQLANSIGLEQRREDIFESLNGLKTPCRATEFSAGYDFFSPFTFTLNAGDTVRLPLFIKIENMPTSCVLLIFNRSSLALNKGLRLDNHVAVIDSDYKQGIWFQATATKDITITKNQAICQGVFVPFIVVDNEKPKKKRTGGLGSTDRG